MQEISLQNVAMFLRFCGSEYRKLGEEDSEYARDERESWDKAFEGNKKGRSSDGLRTRHRSAHVGGNNYLFPK